MAATPSIRTAKRRWLSFSLRGALILLTALCIWLAILATRARQQELAIRKIMELRGVLRFDYQQQDRSAPDKPRPPEWLQKAVGEEYFRKVVSVDFAYGGGAKVTDDDLALLAGLPDLTTIELGNNKTVTDAGLKHLAGLRKLRTLYLYRNTFTGDGLRHLPRDLECLSLSKTPIGDAGLAHLAGMRKLKILQLPNTAITDRGLAELSGLSSLEDLQLMQTDITDAGLEHLKSMPSLQRIALSGTNVTSQGVARLRQALPHCEIRPSPEEIDWRNEPPVDIALWPEGHQPSQAEVLEKVTELGGQAMVDTKDPQQPIVRLTLDDSQFSDKTLLVLLDQMPNLQLLNLRRVRAGDALAQKLPRWSKLWYLSLDDSRITNAGLAYVGKLTTLRELSLNGTGITDAGLIHLSGLTNLEQLHTDGTRITDQGRARLKQSLPKWQGP